MSEILLGFAMGMGLLALTGLGVLALRLKGAPKPADQQREMLLALQNELNQLKVSLSTQMLDFGQKVTDRLQESNRVLESSVSGYQNSMGQVQHRLGELQEATKSMVDIGKDISSLQEILRTPKLRGGLGELLLSELLGQILPSENFELQYTFKSGTKVDAIIRLNNHLIPVDSKFPLENFKRILENESDEEKNAARKVFIADVKKHIDAISDKYILPDEGTLDFALMYIPAENVYYESILKDESKTENLYAYSLKKKVIPVSPNSFYAYLQTILWGLKGMKIEQSARSILKSLGQLEGDLKRCYEDFEKIGGHLDNAKSSYDKTEKRLTRLQTRLSTIDTAEKPLIPVE